MHIRNTFAAGAMTAVIMIVVLLGIASGVFFGLAGVAAPHAVPHGVQVTCTYAHGSLNNCTLP